MQASDIFASGDNFQKQRHQVDVARAIFDARDIGSVNHNENIRPLSSLPDKLVGECPPSLSGQTPSGRGDNLHVYRDPMIPINESGRNTHEVLKAFAQSIAKKRTSRITQIGGATRHEDVFSILDGIKGCSKIVARLRYLHEITQDNDPEDPPMRLSSLRELAQFFVNDNVSIPDPGIGISPNGLLQSEWHLSKASALMKFLPDGKVRFAATRGRKSGVRPIHGEDTKENALKRILSYIEE